MRRRQRGTRLGALLIAGLFGAWAVQQPRDFLASHGGEISDALVQSAVHLPFLSAGGVGTAAEILARHAGVLPAAYKLKPPGPGQQVPRIIWVAVSNASEELPGSLLSFFERNSEWQVNVVGNRDKDVFIDTVFANTSVQVVYHMVSPLLGAAKADIWRYAVLYLFGGVYIDYDSDIKIPLREVVRDNDTLIVSEEGSNFHECYIPSYPLSNNFTFTRFGTNIRPSTNVAAGNTPSSNLYVTGLHPETGHPVFFDGKFIVQWAIIAAPLNALFHRTLSNIVDLMVRDYFRETVILLHKHTHRMLQLLCTTNYVFTSSLRQLLLESGASGQASVAPRVLHDDWREYKGKCKAIWTGSDPTHYRKIMRAGHKGHDLLRAYSSDPVLLSPAVRAVDGWAVSAYASGRSVFVVHNGAKRNVPDYDTFLALGLAPDKVLHIPDIIFSLLPSGVPVKSGSSK